MKIVVLEKQVPDSTEITVDKKTGALIRDGVPAITNPDDLAGLEAALELKDKIPDTEVVVFIWSVFEWWKNNFNSTHAAPRQITHGKTWYGFQIFDDFIS